VLEPLGLSVGGLGCLARATNRPRPLQAAPIIAAIDERHLRAKLLKSLAVFAIATSFPA